MIRACEEIVASKAAREAHGAQEPGVYMEIHEDSEHRATMRAGCAVDLFTSSHTFPIPTILKPPSTYVISPVIAEARSERRNAATFPTSSMVILRRRGAVFST